MSESFDTRFGKITQAQFKAPFWARNAHVQTIWPKYISKQSHLKHTQERISTEDDDFLDLAWAMPEKPQALLVAFHGLEGSINSHYIRHLFSYLNGLNIGCVLMHFRGCSGENNLQARAYHSGETSDARYVIDLIHQRFPDLPLHGAGFSLGGNMLLKLLAEEKPVPLTKAVAVSAPINLSASSNAINAGFSRIYQNHLLKSMKRNVLSKMAKVDMSQHINVSANDIDAFTSFYEFDEHITSKLHGYSNAADYYQRASAIDDLHKINTPTLILHAQDDPFMDSQVIPSEQQLSAKTAYELSPFGGHVGFIQGQIHNPKMWLPQRIASFLKEAL